ncbi:very short patch repair endonuclease [Euzebya tangerina]|uniref:very short patch repair endonuclease n=1 Tax=Euzebya tangerina TaxID=591198 RepID=UPI00196ADADF|nr:very short patch repair endonuclease [Euzebya tangerina]
MPRSVRIEPGVDAPYAEPTSPAASKMGRANRRRDTTPELRLRSALFARGLRFRVDLPIRTQVLPRAVRPDVVFTRSRLAIFVDGCFWHRCPEHFVMPKSNLSYWRPKLEANVRRDHRVTSALADAGWTPLRFWEHEDAEEIADLIAIRHRRTVDNLP